MEAATAAYQAALADVTPYLTDRGIDHDTAVRLRLGAVKDPISGHEHVVGRLAIPSLGLGGVPYAMRFRAIRGEEPKYLGTPGETRLYNLWAVYEAGSTICITEGEIDSITLEQCGYPSVGVTGANAWKRHHPRIFAGFSRVLVFGDGDTAGRGFARTLTESMRQAISVPLPDGEDINSLFVAGGVDAINDLMKRADSGGP